MNETHDVGHITGSFSLLESGPLFGVDEDVPVCVARSEPPAFIDVDVLIASIFQSG